jgi:hypothetical protein
MSTHSPHYLHDDEIATNSLDIARDAFTWLVTGPEPLSLNGRLFPGLPDRSIALDEVRDRLLAKRCPQATRDAVWAHLVLRARTDGATWTVAAVGVALPALTAVAAKLSKRFAGDRADIHAEVLHGFLTHLSTIDLSRPKIMLRLRWAAYRSGHRALTEALSGPTPVAPGFRSSPPNTPWGHPDLVLARAVADGVLTPTEADVIGATRLEDVPIEDWAATRHVGYWAAYKTRKRAEARLIDYLRDRPATEDSDGPVTDPVIASLPTGSARARRQVRHHVSSHSSPSVADCRRHPIEKVRDLVSKNGPKSGVQGCGSSPRSTTAPEVPRCA